METTQDETHEPVLAQVPEYKTRNIDAGETELILLVLDTSIKMGKSEEFHYSSMSNLNHEALQRTKYIDKAIALQKELFIKLDQRSYTYERIINTARLALRKLQDDGCYNYYSADLITKFLQLEEIIAGRKSVGIRWIEEKERVLAENKPVVVQPVNQSADGDDGVYLPEGINGKKLDRYKKKMDEQKEVGLALKEMSFIDEEPTNEDLESMEEESKTDISTLSFE